MTIVSKIFVRKRSLFLTIMHISHQKFPHHILPSYTVPNLFGLDILCDRKETRIDMQLFIEDVTTANMPHVLSILKLKLPTILESKCFNDKKLPFAREVRKTEIGHLFEHILLEYLCKEKISLCHNEAAFSGVTNWNWNKESYGKFHIVVDITYHEKDILYIALEQSIRLLRHILTYTSPNIDTRFFSVHSPKTRTLSPKLLVTTKKQMD